MCPPSSYERKMRTDFLISKSKAFIEDSDDEDSDEAPVKTDAMVGDGTPAISDGSGGTPASASAGAGEDDE
jgi:hypothetical protein